MADLPALPPAFLKTLRDVHADADAWLEGLPRLIAACETRWNLRVVGQAARLSYALVLFAERETGAQGDTTGVVLKLSPPSPEVSREAEALRRYGGNGICRLLGHDPDGEVLLLEKLTPGTSLWDLWTPAHDDAHIRLAAQLMTRLWRPVSHFPAPPAHPFRTLASWAEALFEQTAGGRLPYAQVRRAQGLFAELHVTNAPVLLHADLHHGNILSAHREPYLAIDPKGIVGARGYEVGPYLLNPELERHSDLDVLCARRVAIFSEMLGMDEAEMAAWGFVHMLLSACWSLEDHGGGHETALRVAASLERLL